MKDAKLIRESYSEIQQFYLQGIDDAVLREDFERRAQLLERFRISELAFFVLFWGQFESQVDSVAFGEKGECYTEWVFMERVRLFCVSADHDFYEDIDKYYDWRCDLAHGRTLRIPELHLPVIFDRIEEIVEAMDKGPLPLGDIFPSFF